MILEKSLQKSPKSIKKVRSERVLELHKSVSYLSKNDSVNAICAILVLVKNYFVWQI